MNARHSSFWPRLSAGVLLAVATISVAAADEPIRVGIIGLDTSHAPAFMKLFNNTEAADHVPGCRVVAAYPQGSRDIASSVSRVPEYTKVMQEAGVEIVDSIDELLTKVDAVLLESNDGRVHLEQAAPVLAAGKRVFIDKPLAGSLADAIAIFKLAEHHGTPVFTASGLRFGEATQAVRHGSLGKVLGASTYSPCSLEATHMDLAWYGIHGCEALFTLMGTGCQQVTRAHSDDFELVIGVWEGAASAASVAFALAKPAMAAPPSARRASRRRVALTATGRWLSRSPTSLRRASLLSSRQKPSSCLPSWRQPTRASGGAAAQ